MPQPKSTQQELLDHLDGIHQILRSQILGGDQPAYQPSTTIRSSLIDPGVTQQELPNVANPNAPSIYRFQDETRPYPKQGDFFGPQQQMGPPGRLEYNYMFPTPVPRPAGTPDPNIAGPPVPRQQTSDSALIDHIQNLLARFRQPRAMPPPPYPLGTAGRAAPNNIPDNFTDLIRDPRTGALRPPTGTTPLGPPQPKSGMQRAYDFLTNPYAGTQGPGKEGAWDIQRQKESPYVGGGK